MYQVHLSRQYNHTARNNFFYADSVDDAAALVRALYALADMNDENGKVWISIQYVDKPFYRHV